MRPKSWLKQSPVLLLWLVACSSGGTDDPSATTGGNGSGSTSGTSTGSTTGAAGQPGVSGSGTAAGTGSVSSGGMSVGTGGTASVAGTTSTAGTGTATAGSAGTATGVAGNATDPCAGVTCGTGQTCSNGSCMCMTGMLCPDGCFDTQNDQDHCGNCTTKCAADGACVSGACVNPMCNPDTEQRSGHITTYNLATSMVACHYPTSTLPQYYGAMNEFDWAESAVCGACVEITNSQNQKKLVVQITDECPYKGNEQWCTQGSHHIDLNGAAYGALGANNNPAITWKYVPCTTTGNLKYYFDKAVQQYYLAVTPMNARNRVAKMEVQVMGQFKPLTRTNYGTYELTTGAGTGALTFRVTDIYNHVVVESVMMAADKVVDGTKQFAACP
jgi:expansin (peptidoglycan-binding protein)